eukprot:908906-Pleurochrysis_carterae.AAC.1
MVVEQIDVWTACHALCIAKGVMPHTALRFPLSNCMCTNEVKRSDCVAMHGLLVVLMFAADMRLKLLVGLRQGLSTSLDLAMIAAFVQLDRVGCMCR